MEQDVILLSPEKAILNFRLAGLGVRAGANVVDFCIVVLLFFLEALALSYTIGQVDDQLSTGIILFSTLILPVGYFVLLEGLWNGQTVGKKMFNLRVRMADGLPVSFAAALVRNFMRPADLVPGFYFVGLLAVFSNPRAQRIGDLVAGTIVCQDRRPEPQFAITPHSVGMHPLEMHVGSLQGMTSSEYYTLRKFADRFPELSPDVQEKLVQQVYTPIAERRHIPSYPNVHEIYLAEAAVMKYGRDHGLL